MSTIFVAVEYEYDSSKVSALPCYASKDKGKLKEWTIMMEDKNKKLREKFPSYNPINYNIYEIEVLE